MRPKTDTVRQPQEKVLSKTSARAPQKHVVLNLGKRGIGDHHTLFNSPHDGIVILDTEGRHIFVNAVVAERSGYPAEWFLGKSYLDVIRPEDRGPARERLQTVMQGETVPPSEVAYQRASGDLCWLEINSAPLYDGDRIIGLLGIARDITDRKRAEVLLQESEARYRALFEQSPDAILIFDPKTGEMIAFNDKAHEDLGYTRDEFKTLRMEEHKVLESPDELTRRREELLQKGSGSFETKHRTRSGEIRDVHITARVVFIQGKPLVQSIWHDITEKKRLREDLKNLNARLEIKVSDRTREIQELNTALQAELAMRKKMHEELGKSEERYRTAIECSNDGVLMIKEGKITYCNSVFLQMFGYQRPEEAIGKDVLETVHPDDREWVANRYNARMAGQTVPGRHDLKGIRKDGTVIYVEASISIISYQGERIALAFLRDVTARRLAEETLSASEERYRVLVEHAIHPIIVVQDGVFRFVNPKFTEATGYTKEELLSKPFIELIHPEDRQMVMEAHARRLSGEAPDAYAFRGMSKSGEIRWHEITGTPFTWQGKPAHLYFINDVTRWKEAEEKALLQRDLAMELAGTFSLASALPACVETAIKISGTDCGSIYVIEPVSGDLSHRYWHGISDRFAQKVSCIRRGSEEWVSVKKGRPGFFIPEIGIPYKEECLKEGIKVLGMIPFQHNGSVLGCLIVGSHVRDTISVQERHRLEIIGVHIANAISRIQVEEALARSEQQYRDLVENSLVGIYQTDVSGRMLYANEACSRMLGYASPKDLMKVSVWEQWSDSDDRKALLKKIKKTGKINNIEERLVTKTGQHIDVLASVTVDGGILSGMILDITEQKQIQREILDKTLKLEEMNTALRILLEQRDQDRVAIGETVSYNVKELIIPYIQNLNSTFLTAHQKTLVDLIERSLNNIISPFVKNMQRQYSRFTPSEVKVANFIREGREVKGIALMLGVSESAVHLHRQHIRQKLGLKNKKINLKTYLQSLAD